MYESIIHQSHTLKEWQKIFSFQFSLGELYRMAKGGIDFMKLGVDTELQ